MSLVEESQIMLALSVSGCVSAPKRGLSLDEVNNWSVSEVKVEFAADAIVNLSNMMNSYVTKQISKVSPELVGLPIDPANPGRNVYAEKAQEIAATAEARSAVRLEGAAEVRQRFQTAFAAQPAGKRSVRLVLNVKQLTEAGQNASIIADTRFVDARTGQALMEGLTVNVIRQPRGAYSSSLAGAIAVAVVSGVMTAAENQGRTQLQFALDQAGTNLREWLLKKEGE
jgi:hypothetical protein